MGLSFAATTALVLLGGIGATLFSNHTATAEEITGIIKAHNVTSQRLTLRNGAIFSVPSFVSSEALTVGSVVRVEFEEYGEYNDELVVTNIVPICNDVTVLPCRQFRNAQQK